MIKRLALLLSSLVVSSILTSCSTDRLEAINFPEAAKPGQTISVAMVNAYTYLSISRKVMSGFGAQRDSIHLMMRVPEGYEIIGVKTAVIRDLNISSFFGQIDNLSNLAPQLAQYTSQLAAMSRNTNLDNKFKERTIDAHSSKDQTTTIPVSTSQGTWAGYSAPFGVSFKAGDTLDTIISVDSILGLVNQMGIDTSSLNLDSIMNAQALPIAVDSIAFSTIPALIQVTLKTKATTGKDTLYFYSTTASAFPTQAEIDSGSTIDLGSMLFSELNVSESASSVQNFAKKIEFAKISVIKNAGSCKIIYNLKNSMDKTSISIYSSLGILVRKIPLSSEGYGVWDYTDKSGIDVSTGRYFATVSGNSGNGALPIDVIR